MKLGGKGMGEGSGVEELLRYGQGDGEKFFIFGVKICICCISKYLLLIIFTRNIPENILTHFPMLVNKKV